MAVWQFRAALVPHAKTEQLDEDLFELGPLAWIDDEAIRDQPWWNAEQPLAGYEAALDRLLPRSRSWSADIWQWGNLESDCVEVYREASRVTDIVARFDLRAPNEPFIIGIRDLAQDWYCDVLTPDGHIVTPANLFVLIRNSPALRFVEDPFGFLDRVARGGYTDA